MLQQSHFVRMVRNVLPTSNVQGKKNELDCKNNELFLGYNLENKTNFYLNHMPPAAEALGKMVILGVVQWQDQSGQCPIPRLFLHVRGKQLKAQVQVHNLLLLVTQSARGDV